MGIKHIDWAHNLDWHFDSPTQRYVFLEMVWWSDRKGITRFTQQEIGERLLLSRQTVSREVGRLREIGLLTRLAHGRYGIRLTDGTREAKAAPPSPEPTATPARSSPSAIHDWCTICSEMFEEPIDSNSIVVVHMPEEDARFAHVKCLREASLSKRELDTRDTAW